MGPNFDGTITNFQKDDNPDVTFQNLTLENGAQYFKCQVCPRVFRSEFEIQIHNKEHSKKKCFECSYCPYKSMWKYNLDKHIRMHTGERPYACQFCPYKARQPNHLDAHMKIHTNTMTEM